MDASESEQAIDEERLAELESDFKVAEAAYKASLIFVDSAASRVERAEKRLDRLGERPKGSWVDGTDYLIANKNYPDVVRTRREAESRRWEVTVECFGNEFAEYNKMKVREEDHSVLAQDAYVALKMHTWQMAERAKERTYAEQSALARMAALQAKRVLEQTLADLRMRELRLAELEGALAAVEAADAETHRLCSRKPGVC